MAPLQYSSLESPVDRGAWRATAHGVAKSQTRLKRLSATANAGPAGTRHPGAGTGRGQPTHWLAADLWGERSSARPIGCFPLEFNGKDRLPVVKKRNQCHIKDFPNLLTVSPHTAARMTFLTSNPTRSFRHLQPPVHPPSKPGPLRHTVPFVS